MREDQPIAAITRTIYASFPDAEISVLDNPRDNAGCMIYVSNAPEEFSNSLSRFMEFVTVPIDSRNGDYMVIPLPEEEPPEDRTTL